jgi:hypothetical protein
MPQPNPETMSPVVLAHMDELDQMRDLMEGELGDAYDRVLTAGMKMMYSPDNAQLLQQLITDEKIPVENKLGEGVANLLVMMDNAGNGTIPKEVLVPVGVALLLEATDYLYEIGIEVTEEQLGNALLLMIEGVFVGYGIDPKKMEQFVDDLAEKMGFEEGADANEAAEPADEEAAFNAGFEKDQAARQAATQA